MKEQKRSPKIVDGHYALKMGVTRFSSCCPSSEVRLSMVSVIFSSSFLSSPLLSSPLLSSPLLSSPFLSSPLLSSPLLSSPLLSSPLLSFPFLSSFFSLCSRALCRIKLLPVTHVLVDTCMLTDKPVYKLSNVPDDLKWTTITRDTICTHFQCITNNIYGFGKSIFCSFIFYLSITCPPIYFYPSILVLTHPNDGWTGLCIKLCCILYHKSPTPFVFCCYTPFSSHSFQISLNTVFASHSQFPSPPFPSTFWASALFSHFSSPILSTCLAHFSLILLPSCFVNIPLLQPPLSVHPVFSCPLSSLPRFFLSSCFHKPTLSHVLH